MVDETWRVLGCPITSQRGHIAEYLFSLPYEYAISILIVYFFFDNLHFYVV